MDFKFLKYLARTGAINLHPHKGSATNVLISALGLQDGMKVLEIGCGTGSTLVRLGINYDLQLFGTDLIPEMIKVAKKRLKLAGLTNDLLLTQMAIGTPLPFPNQLFDRVYAESVVGIQDASSTRLILNEAYRVLKNGGMFVANEAIWKKTTAPETVPVINQACLRDFGLRQASEQPWKIDDWLSLFRECGFVVLSSKLLADHLAENDSGSSISLSFRMLASDVLTIFYKAISLINPVLLSSRIKFNILMRKHYLDAQQIESRLFILKKP